MPESAGIVKSRSIVVKQKMMFGGGGGQGGGFGGCSGDPFAYRGESNIPWGTFCQSARNRSSPTSVRGCFSSCCRTEGGTVATWAADNAASTKWRGCRILATRTWAGKA